MIAIGRLPDDEAIARASSSGPQFLRSNMEPLDSLSDRLVRVETTLMHLEHDFEQLHEVVLSQSRQIEDLRRSLERLQSLLDQEGPAEVRDPAAEKPPHY